MAAFVSADRVGDISYPPPHYSETRTAVRDGHFKMALAIFKDALDLMAWEPGARRYGVADQLALQSEARRWLTDLEWDDVFSLRGVLMTMEVFGGVPWNPEAVAAQVLAGKVHMVRIDMKVKCGGKGEMVREKRAYVKKSSRWTRPSTNQQEASQ